MPGDELRRIEDQCIRDAVAMQERVGLQSISDGELRRSSWRDLLFESANGFSSERYESNFTFTQFTGEKNKGMPVPKVISRLERRQPLTADQFSFLATLTTRMPKATLPSPSVAHFFRGDDMLRGSPYRDRRAYFADVARIYREEIADLATRGCVYLQIDDVPSAVLCDPSNQEVVRARGEDPDELENQYIELHNDAVRDRPKSMTLCVHLCRGNTGHGQASGGYEPVAERLFQQLDADAFFLEYDTERAGGFEPLRFMPKDRVAVLGLYEHEAARARAARHVAPARGCGRESHRSGAAVHQPAMRLRVVLSEHAIHTRAAGAQARPPRRRGEQDLGIKSRTSTSGKEEYRRAGG